MPVSAYCFDIALVSHRMHHGSMAVIVGGLSVLPPVTLDNSRPNTTPWSSEQVCAVLYNFRSTRPSRLCSVHKFGTFVETD